MRSGDGGTDRQADRRPKRSGSSPKAGDTPLPTKEPKPYTPNRECALVHIFWLS